MDAVQNNDMTARYLQRRFSCAAECRERLIKNDFRDFEAFYTCIYAYTLAKYLLPEDETEDSIDALAAKSVSYQMKIPEEVLRKSDRPSGCTKATAVADKKILLLLSVSKVLGVKLASAEVPAVKTVRQLAGRLWERRCHG